MNKEYGLHEMDCNFLLKNEMSVLKALILFYICLLNVLWHLAMSWQIAITSDVKPLHTEALSGKWLKAWKGLKLLDYEPF